MKISLVVFGFEFTGQDVGETFFLGSEATHTFIGDGDFIELKIRCLLVLTSRIQGLVNEAVL